MKNLKNCLYLTREIIKLYLNFIKTSLKNDVHFNQFLLQASSIAPYITILTLQNHINGIL